MLERTPRAVDVDDQWPMPCRPVNNAATALRNPATASASSAVASVNQCRIGVLYGTPMRTDTSEDEAEAHRGLTRETAAAS